MKTLGLAKKCFRKKMQVASDQFNASLLKNYY